MSKIRMYMGVPSTGNRSDSQCYVLRDLEERYGDRIDFVYPKTCVYRSFHDFARNSIVEEFLESGCDVLWFLDSDVAPPNHILDLITMHWDKWQAAGACYPIWMVPPGCKDQSILFTAYKNVVKNTDGSIQGIGLTSVPRSGLDWVDGLATGCIFLKKEVFEKLEKPYFEFKFEKESRRMSEGEDLGFCIKLAAQGIKFFTDYGMVCKHYKTVCLLDINNYATDMANAKVLEYDAYIRPIVKQLEQKIIEKRAAAPAPQAPKSGLILPSHY